MFEVVARPNGWQKDVKKAGGGATAAVQGGGVNALRQDFFAEVLSDVVAARPAIRMPTRSTQNWTSFASGPWGYWALSIATAGRLRIEAYIDTNDANLNKTIFDELNADAGNWEAEIAYPLTWERLDGKRASRIAVYRAVTDLSDPTEREQLRTWAAGAVLALYDAMNDRLRARARELRQAIKAPAGPPAADYLPSS